MRKAAIVAIAVLLGLVGYAAAASARPTRTNSAAHRRHVRRKAVRCKTTRQHRRKMRCRAVGKARISSASQKRPAKRRPATAKRRPTPGTTQGAGPVATTGSSAGTTEAPLATPAWATGNHIATWAYDDGCNGGSGASAALVQQWATFAESNCGPRPSKVMSDCHAAGATYCTAVQYLDSSIIYPTSVPISSSSQENWWLHEPGYSDSRHRLSIPDWGGGNYLNQSNPGVDAWFRNYVQTNLNAYDALMMDDTAGSMTGEFWGTGFSSSAEITSDNALMNAHRQITQSITHTNGTSFLQIDNGISVNPYLPNTLPLLNDPANVNGLITEGAPMSNGTLTNFYPTMLDEMAYIDHTANDFMVLLSYDSSGSLQARRMQAASVLLGYSPGHTASWSDLETNSSDLAVWPEEGVVPTAPVQSMSAPGGAHCLDGAGIYCASGGHNDLQVAPGVYRREFGECYNHGAAFGRCAVIVDTTGAPVTVSQSWLTGTYLHQMTMVGGDVQSGGAVNPTGGSFTAGATALAAHDAVLISG